MSLLVRKYAAHLCLRANTPRVSTTLCATSGTISGKTCQFPRKTCGVRMADIQPIALCSNEYSRIVALGTDCKRSPDPPRSQPLQSVVPLWKVTAGLPRRQKLTPGRPHGPAFSFAFSLQDRFRCKTAFAARASPRAAGSSGQDDRGKMIEAGPSKIAAPIDTLPHRHRAASREHKFGKIQKRRANARQRECASISACPARTN
jgi:hypothetical protein